MPAFGDRVDEKHTDAAIAYFQSFWTDDTYATWLKNSGQTEVAGKRDEDKGVGEDTSAVTASRLFKHPIQRRAIDDTRVHRESNNAPDDLSITSKTQWDSSVADSQRKRSILHKLSFI